MRSAIKKVASAALIGIIASASSALAAGKSVGVIDNDWSFEGPFGTFDQAELQRGWQVYSQVCAGCHSMNYLSYRNLGDPNGPGFPEEQVEAIAAQFDVEDGPNADGEMFMRPARPSDNIASPWRNRQEAEAANGGAYPPDLSLIAKARTGYTGIITQLIEGGGGPEYLYSLLLGYTDEPPEGFEVGSTYYNKYYPGHRIAMAQPLYGDDVDYQDGTEATIEQQAHDVTAFLTWAAEPKMVERKEAGVRNIVLLTIFAVLVWYSNRKLWKPIKQGDDV